jgi:hypothetical protein
MSEKGSEAKFEFALFYLMVVFENNGEFVQQM